MKSKRDDGFWSSTAGVIAAVMMGAVGLPLLICVSFCAGIFGLWQ